MIFGVEDIELKAVLSKSKHSHIVLIAVKDVDLWIPLEPQYRGMAGTHSIVMFNNHLHKFKQINYNT